MLEIIEFCKLIGKLKKFDRTGWITRVGIENPESVADHSFRTAIMSMIISDLKKLDAEKVIRMSLLHDMAESITDDFDLHAKKRFSDEELREKEQNAINSMLSHLPNDLREKYSSIIGEFQAQETEEAKLVNQIDKLEMLLQALEYEKEGYDKDRLEHFWKNTEPLIRDDDLREILRLIKKERL
jgi:putative hydrolase of HD superfamily